MSKRSCACEFSKKERRKIYERDDHSCIFCNMGIFPQADHRLEVAHYIPRSQGGLGIEQNGALACKWHHHMLDNGELAGLLEGKMKEYLMAHYPEWDEDKLRYSK